MLKLITAPSVEPVSTEEAKAHLRIVGSADDTMVAALITAAREYVESDTGRALCAQTWERRLHRFPPDMCFVELPLAPLTGLVSVEYLDASDALVEATLSDFLVVAPTGPTAQRGCIGPKPDKAWPTGLSRQPFAARIRFVAGYGDASAVPQSLKSAILLKIGDLYANREGLIIGTIVAPNPTIDMLLSPYRTNSV